MAFLNNLSLKTKLTATIAVMLVLLAGALTFKSTSHANQALHGFVDRENYLGMSALLYTMRESYPNLTRTPEHDAESLEIVWPRMPNTILFNDVDSAFAITGLNPTVFHFEEDTQQFMRIGTTLREENGNRSVATELAPGPAYDALINGEMYTGHATVRGSEYEALYVPVFEADGTVNGAFAVVRPLDTLRAKIQDGIFDAVAIALAVLLVMLLAAFFTIRKMLIPLTHMTKSIGKLSQGTLDEEIGYQNRTDEIGEIASSLVVLQQSMQQAEDLKRADAERSEVVAAKQRDQDIVVTELTKGLSRLANLDLTQQIESSPDAPFPAEYEGLRTSYNLLVDNLSETVEAIREVADEVNSDAREMASSSADLSSRTEAQAATLEESAAALEELSASVQSTASNAGDAESTTNDNRTNAKRAGEIVETANVAMAAIEESSQKITQIISVIDDIAFQTNLLALNAGVEAARAGEAGRGFAVVASEVRALAQHSSASAQEIKDLIASSSDHVDNGSKLVRKAGDSISDIIERVDRVAGLVSDIAISAKEQSIGVTEINSGVRELDAATQRNAAMAEEASAASEGLTTAADRLAEHLGRFQLANSTSTQNWATTTTPASLSRDDEVAQAAEAFAPKPTARTSTPTAVNSQANVFQDF